MAKPLLVLLYSSLLLLLSANLLSSTPVSILVPNSTDPVEVDDTMLSKVCSGEENASNSVSTAMEDNDGDSETGFGRRRILSTQRKYISYEVLRRDVVLCGERGASYYNCHAHPTNLNHRGCEVITYCARDL